MEVRLGNQVRNLEAGTEADAAYWLAPCRLLSHSPITTQDYLPRDGNCASTRGWAYQQQSLIKKINYKVAYREYVGSILSYKKVPFLI